MAIRIAACAAVCPEIDSPASEAELARSIADVEIIAASRIGLEDVAELEALELGPHSRDMDCKAVGARRVIKPPDIAQQLLLRNALARLLGEPPKQREFARVQAKPAIFNPSVPVDQVERNVASLAEARKETRVLLLRADGPASHKMPPARIE